MSESPIKFTEDARVTYGPDGLADILKIIGYENADALYERLDEVERNQFVDERFTDKDRGTLASNRLDYLLDNAPRLVPVSSAKLRDISAEISRTGVTAEQATYLSLLAGPSSSLGFSSSEDVQFDYHPTVRTERWSVWHVHSAGASFVEIARFNYVPSILGEQYAVYRLYSVDFSEGQDPIRQTLFIPLGTGFDHVSNSGIQVGRWSVIANSATPNAYSYVTPSGQLVTRTLELDAEIVRIPDGYVMMGASECFQQTWESDKRPGGYAAKYTQRMVDSFREEGDPDPHEVTGWLNGKFYVAQNVPRGGVWNVQGTVYSSGGQSSSLSLSRDASGKYTVDGVELSATAQGAQIGDSFVSNLSSSLLRDTGQLPRDELYPLIARDVFSGVENVSGSEWPLASRSDKAEAGSLLALPVLLVVLMIVAATFITINLVL